MRASRNGHDPRHMPEVGEYTPADVAGELLPQVPQRSPGYRAALAVSGVLLALGVLAFVIRAAADGFDDRAPWAYYAAAFAFLLTTVGSAPLVSIALRFARSHWRRGLSRASELFAVSGLFMLLMYIPLLFVLPEADGRHTLWVDWHGHAPHVYDTLALATLVLCGLALLYTGARPDFAALRDRAEGGRRRLYERLAAGWQGDNADWHRQKVLLGFLGAFYFMLLIFVHLMISTDFVMTLVPGWHDSIYPAFHALTGLQAAVAVVLVAAFLLRGLNLGRYLYLDQFWGLAKILLALSLLWVYFWWSGFLVYWYGRTEAEIGVLNYLIKDTYYAPFVLAFLLSFLVPVFFMLIWNPIRKSVKGPAITGTVILFGAMLERVREYVAAFSVPDELVGEELLPRVLPTHIPDVLDIMLVLGAVGGAAFFYLLALRLLPPVSVWEQHELALLRKVRPYLKRYAVVLGKPE